MVAYAFSRFYFPGRDIFFLMLLATIMLPGEVTLIPRYLLFRYLHWTDSLKPLIIPAYTGSAFYVFLLRQFFMTLPIELDEAAVIDGANRFTILWLILMPLLKPIIVTIVAFQFIGTWNDFMGPLIYCSSLTKDLVLALGLLRYTDYEVGLIVELLMPASIMSLIPVFIVFMACQRAFITGITMSGMKEG
jgi:ABC-type glycerol-3-phosphate transport system permease component